jgi:gluconate kinase
VIGTTSSGKSTLANQLARKISGDFIELDALHWEPNWKEAPNEVFRNGLKTPLTQTTGWLLGITALFAT